MNPEAAIAFTLPSLVTVEVTEKKETVDKVTGVVSHHTAIYAEYKEPKSLCPNFILETLKVQSYFYVCYRVFLLFYYLDLL